MKESPEYTEHLIDLAEDDLEQIILDKQNLMDAVECLRGRDIRSKDYNLMSDCIEESFDEAFTPLWRKSVTVSGNAGWPANIPPRTTLSFVTPKQRKDRGWAKRQRIVTTNPATRMETFEGDVA